MTRDKFIELLQKNIKPNAEMRFLVSDRLESGKHVLAFLDVTDVCMNADVDDPKNKYLGGVVFRIQKDLSI